MYLTRSTAATCSVATDARNATRDDAPGDRAGCGAVADGKAVRRGEAMTGWLERGVVLAALLAGALISPLVGAEEGCGSIENAYGPFDYYADKEKLPVVERHHFTADVEFFRKELTGPFGADIDYTLRAFPNHPRALAAIIRLGEVQKSERPTGARHTLYCYLERAIRFRPHDGSARLMMATYLLKIGRSDEAAAHLDEAVAVAGNDGNLHYNLGLAFYRLRRWEDSLRHAHAAYRLGFDLPGLRTLLTAAGKWRDPPSP